ncbi:MAG: ATP-dependent nuclease [Aulosira sp. ZfuVER01]|nr:AAA family ATPase [Aulosira sp. ZfuVER01]MDZ7996380.1 AAA family ATPase [Aulosira sp. DedVER01a]MDZ8054068.1 AAA family ATPase [Aulosira sp. ZfuCHP01]
MKLESVFVKSFRSIESSELTNCGRFNVLIGKNNSGKSSALSAIHAFFNCLRDGEVLTLKPQISREIDFFNRNTQVPIEISLTFSLTLAERDVLIRDIVTEAPQMKNAVDGIDPVLRLSVTLIIMPPPSSFSYVKKLSLRETGKLGTKNCDSERIILSIDNNSASEIYNNFLSCQELNKNIKNLSHVDIEKIRRFIAQRIRERSPMEILSSFAEINREIYLLIENRVGTKASIEEIENVVLELISNFKDECQAILNQPLKNKVGTFSGEESSIPNYVKNLLQSIGKIKILYLTERRKQIGKEEAERLLSLKVKRGGNDILKNIQETVTALLGVHIDAFESSASSITNQASAEMDVDNFLVEVNGSGIKEALRLLLDVEFENPDILLVEEPEIHLHPALETNTMRYLKRISHDCQVFLTTHSTNFLDTAEMNNVYLVTKLNSTQIQQLDVGEAEAKIPQELGIRLSSLFMFDRLVFVEGQSDEDAIREWASVLGINLSQANVGFIHMGGARNFAHFATEATLGFLTKRQVKMWFLIDRDEKDDSEIQKMQSMLGQNAKIKVLSKREIENYLICSRAIRSFIKYKSELRGHLNEELPTETDINSKIDECAETLKQFAINKRVVKIACKPIYPDTQTIFKDVHNQDTVIQINNSIQKIIEHLEAEKNNLEPIYTAKYNEINADWQSKKLDLVPGDILLDEVCQRYNVRFKKEKDTYRLAGLMEKDEINQEIKDIIQEIVT